MKKILLLLSMSAAGAGIVSCDVDAKFSDYIPVHPLTNLVKSATATAGSETVEGTVDNSARTVLFVFENESDFRNVSVTVEYATRAVLKDGAEAEFTANLSGGNAYTFVVNNLEEDITYSVTASKASILQVDRTECSVVTGLEYDADPAAMNTGNTGTEYLFDGKWMSKKEAYSEVSYHHFGWSMTSNGDAPVGDDGTEYGNAFTVDLGSTMRVARMRFWPYWPYSNNSAALFEIYAWTMDGEPSGAWANWQLIAEVDDSAKWEIVKNAEAGSEDDLTTVGTVVEFSYDAVPDARYYRVKIVKNMYAYWGTAMNQYWVSRQYWYTLSELEVWKYNVE